MSLWKHKCPEHGRVQNTHRSDAANQQAVLALASACSSRSVVHFLPFTSASQGSHATRGYATATQFNVLRSHLDPGVTQTFTHLKNNRKIFCLLRRPCFSLVHMFSLLPPAPRQFQYQGITL